MPQLLAPPFTAFKKDNILILFNLRKIKNLQNAFYPTVLMIIFAPGT